MEDSYHENPTMHIDLTLAINYLPAIEFLVKALLLAFSLCLVNPSEHFGAFAVLFMTLTIDRTISPSRIFDGNALQLCVLLSYFVNTLRIAATAPPAVPHIATAVWSMFALTLIVEPKSVQEFFVMYGHGGGGKLHQILPAIIHSTFVGFFAFLPFPLETPNLRILRVACFVTLTVAWVYVVTLWRNRPKHQDQCVYTTHALVARFGPLLYFTVIPLVIFFVMSCGIIIYHYCVIHMGHSPIVVVAKTEEKVPLTTIEEEEDLEALFKAAKEANK